MPTTLITKVPSAWFNLTMNSWANSGSRDLHLDLRETITPGVRGARELLINALRDAVRSGRRAAKTTRQVCRPVATGRGWAPNSVVESDTEVVVEVCLA